MCVFVFFSFLDKLAFSSHDKKRLGYCGGFYGCLIIALGICTVFKPYLDPLPVCKSFFFLFPSVSFRVIKMVTCFILHGSLFFIYVQSMIWS